MATATSAWASAGASLVPSPVIATSRPCACMSRISLSLASGVASARKSSTPASAAMAAAVSGLSPVIITVLMPMRRSSAKRSRMPPLTMSFELDDAEHRARRRRTTSGVAPSFATRSTIGAHLAAARVPPSAPHVGLDRVGRALADLAPVQVDAAHPRLRGERHEAWRPSLLDVALAEAVLLLGQHDDAAALRRLVGERGELRRVGQLPLRPRPAPGGTASPGGCRA